MFITNSTAPSNRLNPILSAVGDLTINNYAEWYHAFETTIAAETRGYGPLIIGGILTAPPRNIIPVPDGLGGFLPITARDQRDHLEAHARYNEARSLTSNYIVRHVGAQARTAIRSTTDPVTMVTILRNTFGGQVNGRARVCYLRSIFMTEQRPDEDAITFMDGFFDRLDRLSHQYIDANLSDPFSDTSFQRDVFLMVLNDFWGDWLLSIVTDETKLEDLVARIRSRQTDLRLRRDSPSIVAALAATPAGAPPSYLASRAGTAPVPSTPRRGGGAPRQAPSTAEKGADDYPGSENWPWGFFLNKRTGKQQFKLPADMCWRCFGQPTEGGHRHFSNDCPLKSNETQAERARARKLREYGITVPSYRTQALTAAMREVYLAEIEEREAAFAAQPDETEEEWLRDGHGLADDEQY